MDLSQAQWRKAAASTGNNGACVEVAGLGAATAVRDSKAPEAGVHVIDRIPFTTFIADVKAGRYDL